MRFLLNWLTNHLLFAGMLFFAAGAPVIGGGDGGAAVDGGGGDAAGDADVSGDGGADAADAADAADEADSDSDAVQPDGQQPADDGAQIATAEQIKAHIEGLKKTNPALAKELKNTFFMVEALKKEFPGGLPELRQVKQTIEDLGGAEGIEGLKAERAEWTALDDKFIAGDPTVLDDFAKFNPEAFAQIAPAVIDKLAKIDKAAYDYALSGVFAATLDSWRFFDTLDRVAESIGRIVDDKGQPLCAREIQLLSGLAKQYDVLKELAAKAPEKPQANEKDAVSAERAALAQEKTKIAAEYVGNATDRHAEKQYGSIIPAEARNQKLDLERMKSAGSYDRMLRQINEEIARDLAGDKSFGQKIGALLASGRKNEAVQLSNAKFDEKIGAVVKRVVREWATLMNPKGPGAKAGANGDGKPSPAGVKKLESAPDLDMVDKTVPGWRENYMMHSRAKLKTGQQVSW